MSQEREAFRTAEEARADVTRPGRSAGTADVVRRLVDAAVYRETHRDEPQPDTARPR
ncbi:hypothetical protein [Allokutzneria sp. NRRL B-24872]|uniref:hypothetical protein n=1 Tax=Allokutzneria sp. NRRL B-24872 TaxID=1137961 RepID=UPI00143D3F80|nr:hypothetical protein [Allokutzneria sp. NRRL B-24872]